MTLLIGWLLQIPAPALLLPDGKSAIPPEDLPSDTNNLELAGLVMFFKYKSKVCCSSCGMSFVVL